VNCFVLHSIKLVKTLTSPNFRRHISCHIPISPSQSRPSARISPHTRNLLLILLVILLVILLRHSLDFHLIASPHNRLSQTRRIIIPHHRSRSKPQASNAMMAKRLVTYNRPRSILQTRNTIMIPRPALIALAVLSLHPRNERLRFAGFATHGAVVDGGGALDVVGWCLSGEALAAGKTEYEVERNGHGDEEEDEAEGEEDDGGGGELYVIY
jgi:hypothetical protein